MNFRNITSFAAVLGSIAFVPVACGGDSSDDDGSQGGSAGENEGGSAGTTGGTSGTGTRGGSAGQGGSSARGGTSGQGGTSSGSGGEPGDGGLGGVGGEPGGAGESGAAGAGGEPGCTIAEGATVMGTLKITTDDNYRLYVNGALIDETPRIWNAWQTYTVTLFRHPSRKNVVAVEGINLAEISGLDRGIVADLSFDAGAGTQSVVTDTTWKLSTALATNWFALSFDDAAWVAATDEGAHGIPPYGAILGTSAARWIWAYDANVAATMKPDPPESVFVRKGFFVNAAGTVTSAPGTCP